MKTNFLSTARAAFLSGALLILAAPMNPCSSAESANPFAGHWALTIPGGAAGWLGVSESQGKLSASLLWGGGSVVPVAEAKIEGDTLVLTRRSGRRGDSGAAATTETITAKVEGDQLKLTTFKSRSGQAEFDKAEFTGQRTPSLPPAPDLSKVKFGKAIQLFNGRDLEGWKLTNPRAANGWSVQDGVLVNAPVQTEGQPRRAFGNLRTEQEFEDFHLSLEVMVPPRGNSGIYLRGIYEIQVADTHGRPVDSHNMGGVYSRITPRVAAEKPAGEWQTMDITLVNRHVTVILNGKTIIDNQPVAGCTGGALWSDPFRPGPLYLQGDHTSASFRNMILKPVVK